MQKYFAVVSLVLLISMVITKVLILKRKEGIKAFLFGKIDKKDFIILPFVLLFFYHICSHTFGWGNILGPAGRFFFHNEAASGIGVGFCLLALLCFLMSLISFGKSFRVGVDTTKPGKLITTGIFSLTRNPIYVAFGMELLGLFFIFPDLLSSLYFVAGILLFHRQVLIEETFLKAHYGKEYETYCRKVRRYF